MVKIRSIDFFKIAKVVKVPVDLVIQEWDGKEYIEKDKLQQYLKDWKERILNSKWKYLMRSQYSKWKLMRSQFVGGGSEDE